MKVLWTLVDTGVAAVISVISLPFWMLLAALFFSRLPLIWSVALCGAVLSGVGLTLLQRWQYRRRT